MVQAETAQDEMAQHERDADIVEVSRREVACDGGEGALGHPRVFLNMGDADHIDCPYCGRRFVLAADAPAATH